MDEQKKLALPSSSPEVLAKILHAYALCGDKPAPLESVAGRAGLNKTQVSANHGFLVSLGLLEGGRAKTLTPTGKALALAIGHDLDEDIAGGWRRTLHDAPAMQPIVDMLRVQKELPKTTLSGRIGSAVGIPVTPAVRTGINSLIELLEGCSILVEADGKYRYTGAGMDPMAYRPADDLKVPRVMEEIPDAVRAATAIATEHLGDDGHDVEHRGNRVGEKVSISTRLAQIPIHVNIELHLPASSEQGVYDALFKSIRENLLS